MKQFGFKPPGFLDLFIIHRRQGQNVDHVQRQLCLTLFHQFSGVRVRLVRVEFQDVFQLVKPFDRRTPDPCIDVFAGDIQQAGNEVRVLLGGNGFKTGFKILTLPFGFKKRRFPVH